VHVVADVRRRALLPQHDALGLAPRAAEDLPDRQPEAVDVETGVGRVLGREQVVRPTWLAASTASYAPGIAVTRSRAIKG